MCSNLVREIAYLATTESIDDTATPTARPAGRQGIFYTDFVYMVMISRDHPGVDYLFVECGFAYSKILVIQRVKAYLSHPCRNIDTAACRNALNS